jgi:acyl-CoA reductase-like NAD-dependent aldehyde dehydrogenase
MRNPLKLPASLLAVLLCLAVALGACGGGSDSDSASADFPQGYNAAIAKLDRASTALATTEPAGKTRSSRAIARQLDRFADLLADTAKDLAALEPPKAGAGQFRQLRAALDRSIASARRAARAARQIQPARQRAALGDLRAEVVEIAKAQDALQRAIDRG